MKKIHLCTGGVNKSIVENIYNKHIDDVSKDKCLEYYYFTIESGSDDLIQVLNYNVPKLYKVKSGETKLDIMAEGYSVDCDISTDDIVVLNKDSRVKHIVKPLDTLSSIANKYNKSIDEIRSNNNISNDKLYIGQMLYI